MSLGNILSAIDVLNLLVSGIDKTTLETQLIADRWIPTPARGGSKSGQGIIWTSPDNLCSVRIMTKPDGSSYTRVYNGPPWWSAGRTTLKRIRETRKSCRNTL